MTQKDAMEGGGGGDTFQVDPKWPGLDGDVPLEYDVPTIRTIAGELKSYLSGVNGRPFDDGYTTGTLSSIKESSLESLNSGQLGEWEDAQALAGTVTRGGTAFLDAYKRFGEAYAAVVAAMEAHADEYAKTNHANEADRNV
ncbi:hypothetical protein [Microtetraspora sp. NBRC 16547]|uniref:hypothetical protein n=1 Tax=Microtetraspora sp. NBRC 16547 TaxID=3030993 RepID=UPI00249FA9E8|nr:hypothetical protein [Microtetraspora sp. NBRC 16547]GLW96146.1 hypothetical protein Misp02_02330 [Microtetraspora sp. NBRC 16547]